MDEDSIVFYVHPTKGEQCRCGICGQKAPYYDAGRGYRLWRTADIGLHKAELCADSYRVNCPEHGVVTAAVPWARHNSRYTRDFEQTAAWLAMNCSKTALSQSMRISWNSVGPVISRIRADLDTCPKSRFDGLEKIGIDETSVPLSGSYLLTAQSGLPHAWKNTVQTPNMHWERTQKTLPQTSRQSWS